MNLFPPDPKARFEQRWAGITHGSVSSAALEPITLSELLAKASSEQLQRWEQLHLGYTSDQGEPVLRQTLAEKFYPDLSANHLVGFCGAQEALFVAFHALLNGGDMVLCIEPGFQPLQLIPQSLGCVVENQRLEVIADRWVLDVDALCQRLLRNRYRLLVINFPHNPTGAHLSETDFQRIIKTAEQTDTWVLSDEVFRGLELGGRSPLPTAAGQSPRGVSIGAMGKAFGLGGVRVGWLACADDGLIRRCLEIKSYLSICCSRTDEILGLIALDHSDEIFAAHRQAIAANIKSVKALVDGDERLKASNDWLWPEAGCTLFAEYINGDVTELANNMASKSHYLLLPGNCFSGHYPNHWRLGLGHKNLEQRLQALSKHL